LTVNSPLRAMRTLSVVRTGLGWVAVQQRSTIGRAHGGASL
jgi:hypothetical protein